jgi:hypothetical protein
VAHPPIAVLRGAARAGYLGEYRASVTQDDYACVMATQGFGALLARKSRTQFLPGALTRPSRKMAVPEYFLFVQ